MKKALLFIAVLFSLLSTAKMKAQLGLSKQQIINAYGSKPDTKMEIKSSIENGKKKTTITLNFLKIPGVYESYFINDNDICESMLINFANSTQVKKMKSYLNENYVKAPNNRLWVREEGAYIHSFTLLNSHQFYERKILKK